MKIQFENLHNILPHFELKIYIENFLINDKDFINDVDICMFGLSGKNKLIDKTLSQRVEYFSNTIGNEARTYLLKILTLKHLTRILLNNIDGFTDEFWRDRLNMVLQKEDENKEYAQQIQKILINKYPDKTIEEILQLPVETILDYSVECSNDFENSKNTIIEKITLKHIKNKKNKTKHVVLNIKLSNEEKVQRINELIKKDKISISTLQRLFYISFPKAALIIDNLVENGIIERLEKGYNIIDKEKLKDELVTI